MRILALAALLLISISSGAADALTLEQRLEAGHLKAVHEARLKWAKERKPLLAYSIYDDYRTILAVSADDAGRKEALDAAKKKDIRVVVFTGAGKDAEGVAGDVLALNGIDDKIDFKLPPVSGAPEICVACEPTNTASADCVAVFNGALATSKLEKVLQNAEGNPSRLQEVLDNYRAYPEEFFAAADDLIPQSLAEMDNSKKRLTGVVFNNVRQQLKAKDTVIDSCPVCFSHACTHVLARELTPAAIRDSLHAGHAYVACDWLCDSSSFAFGAVNTLGVFPMGDTAPLIGGTRLIAFTPVAAHLKLIHAGKVVQEANANTLTFTTKEEGAYRLEAWLNADGEERPWIISNSVYLKNQSVGDLAGMLLPTFDVIANVDIKKDITYVDGKPEDEAKHKLDVYAPKDAHKRPVFLFVHGGAWRFGDRVLYLPIGHRLAQEGIVSVLPSYRLAPKCPYPAQIEDVAAAFAWTVKHIAEYGGDPEHIYIGGHSAGGHLSALLATNEKYLQPYKLSLSNIRGTLALSGVYDIVTAGDFVASVFGKDEHVQRDASPVFQIKDATPPFLITYCEWDYPSLGAQARQFHQALDKRGIHSELVYVPGENHISEMIHFPKEDSILSQSIIKFIKDAESAAKPPPRKQP